MKLKAILRCGVLFSAALAVFSAAAFSCYAEEESDAAAAEAEQETEQETEQEAENEIFTCGDYTYSVLEKTTEDDGKQYACIEKYSGDETEVEIPSELDGLTVVGFGEYAFTEMHSIRKITLPATVIGLGTYTFAACSRIEEFAVAAGSTAFSAKDGVLYSKDGTSLVRWPLGRDTAEVEIPDGVTAIGTVAFADSRTITSVKFPDTLEMIGNAAFSSCTGLTEITLPDGVTAITDFAFNSCKNLKSVKLPSALTSIGSGAFASTALESVELPDTLVSIGEQAFAATPMESVTIPSRVEEIGYTAFGWDVNSQGELYVKEGFVIRGTANSGAWDYVCDDENKGKLVFEEIEAETEAESSADEPEDSTDAEPETTQPGSGLSTGRVIGISACGVLILGVLTGAALSGRKKKKTNEEKKDDA